MAEQSSELRWIAVTSYIPSVFTYIYAIVLLFGSNSFRDMFNSFPIVVRFVYCIFLFSTQVTLVGILAGPFWDSPGRVYLFCLYFVFSALWIPVMNSHVRSSTFPIDHFFMHRFILVGAWMSSLLASVYLWGDAQTALRVGLVVWCILTSFNAMIFDVLYARWIMRPLDDEIGMNVI